MAITKTKAANMILAALVLVIPMAPIASATVIDLVTVAPGDQGHAEAPPLPQGPPNRPVGSHRILLLERLLGLPPVPGGDQEPR